MGLNISVYRDAGNDGDCSLGGISSKHTTLCVVNISGPNVPGPNNPPVKLVHGNLPGTLKIVPAVPLAENCWRELGGTMMGGNYGATSDSRFSAACDSILGHRFYGAVAIHDRIEGCPA